MISIIITTHNGRKEVCKRAIESVLNQTYKDYEIIVVDDFSQDGTEEMIKELPVIYLRMDKNYGSPARPRNEATKLAKGEYICYLDSDNTFRPNHLETLIKEIEESKVDVVYGDRMIMDENGAQGVGVCSDFSAPLLMMRNYIDTSDFIIKKEKLIEIGGWDERSKRMLDWNLVVRLVKNGCTFKRVPKVITDYYLSDKQLSSEKEIVEWNPIDVEIELPYLKEVKEPRVAIFSITYDRVDYSRKCFKSLYETAGYPFDHYIVDNGSKDETVKYLLEINAQRPNTTLILNKDNKGISIASNQALEKILGQNTIDIKINAKNEIVSDLKDVPMSPYYDIIMKVDNDAYFKNKGWLKKMTELWKSHKNLALSCYIEGLRDNPGGAPRMSYAKIRGELIGVTKHLGGICHFVDAKAYRDFRWNEDSTLHGIQDLEFSNYLTSKGYWMGYLENWYCEHYEGTEGQEKRYKEYFDRRKKEKVTKYDRSYEDIQETESAFSTGTMWGERVIDSINRYEEYFNGKILDIGCNDGLGIQTLEALGYFGVEGVDVAKNKVALAISKGLKVKRGYVEELPYKDKEIDTIFCSHTLEHAKDLKKAVSEIQRVGKRLILIVPIEAETHNPAHTSPFKSSEEVLSLFKGKVLYSEDLSRYEKEFAMIIDLE